MRPIVARPAPRRAPGMPRAGPRPAPRRRHRSSRSRASRPSPRRTLRHRAAGALEQAPEGTIVSRDVTVVEGDTFRAIARRELGRAGFAPQLAEYNQSTDGAPLLAGRLVRIPLHVPARGEVATVVFVKGDVTLDGAALDPDTPVAAGAVLETGADGFLSLEFSSGSVMNLQPLSLVVLERLNCLEDDDSCIVEIGAERGEVRSEVEVRDGQPAEFRVTTPFASAAVRGTEFDLVTDDAELLVGVTEGTVAVAALGVELPVQQGFGSITREGEPPGQPRALLPGPVFSNVPTRVVDGDTVRWFGPEEADAWAATLSLDAAGLETVQDLIIAAEAADASPANVLDVAAAVALDPGDYYLNLRGVDDAGLKGYVSSTRVTLARVDTALALPEVTITPEASEFLVQVDEPDPEAAGYEIQISTDSEFSDPLGVDVGAAGGAVFRIEADTVYARARSLVDPVTVSGYGPTASSDP